MPLTYEPTDLLSRSLHGVASLIAATAQFQTETGKDAATSLDEHCRWPQINKGSDGRLDLPVPLALVSMEASSQRPLLLKPFNRLADGELFVQVALLQSDELTDSRDQFAEAADRFAKIMRQMLTLGSDRNSERWYVTDWSLHQSPGLNDLAEYPFADAEGNELRVWIFPATVAWRG